MRRLDRIPFVGTVKRLLEAVRVDRHIQYARDLMVVGKYEQALDEFKAANRHGVAFTPRDILLFSHCLSVLGKPVQAFSSAEIVERRLLEDSRRFNKNEVAYMIAYSRLIRNKCAGDVQNLAKFVVPINYSAIELSSVSDDLLATFPLVNHPDWNALGWKG